MSDPSDRPGIIAPPPLLLLAAILAGCGADRLASLPILPATYTLLRAGSAVAVVVAAGAIFLAAVNELHKHRTTPNPYEPSTALVTSGIYRFTRNPIYIAFMLIVASVALGANSWWLTIALVILFLLLRSGVVAREERYLSAKFGAAYDSYRDRVHRWL